jgi:hypothetical protein
MRYTTHTRVTAVFGTLLTLLTLVACASTGTVVEDAARQPTAIYQGPDAPTMYSEAPRSVTDVVPRPVGVVRAAVRQALVDYSIPLSVDNAAGQTGNTNFYRTRQFMGRPMTELVSCGSGITGPNAATYRIFMSLIVTAKADESGGTSIAVLFQATGQDLMNGTSNDRLVCSGTGRVEQLLLDRIKTLAAK